VLLKCLWSHKLPRWVLKRETEVDFARRSVSFPFNENDGFSHGFFLNFPSLDRVKI
jgi:hypothetical protein